MAQIYIKQYSFINKCIFYNSLKKSYSKFSVPPPLEGLGEA